MMNSSSATVTHTSRLGPLAATLAASAVLLLAIVAPARAVAGDDHRSPDLGDCQVLKVPAGNKLAFRLFGVGVQIYQWDGTKWTFVAPEAVLFADDEDDDVVGIHFAGPTWESFSGSDVVGTVVRNCTPDPDAIPWLLLSAVSNDSPGIFRRVKYIQRLYTVGGKAPASPGRHPGQMARVRYSAEYYFYRAAH